MNKALTTTDAADNWAAVINEGWRKSILGIVQTGRDLLGAYNDLGASKFARMVEDKLNFGTQTARRLMAIAKHPSIAESGELDALPNSWTVLYELSRLSKEDFDDAKSKELIEPDTTHAAARATTTAYKKNGSKVVGSKKALKRMLPTPKEANKIAAKTGRLVLASDDHVYSGATEAEVVEEKRRQRSSYGVRDAIEFLAQIPEPAAEWKANTMLDYSFHDFDAVMIDDALKWLADLIKALRDAE